MRPWDFFTAPEREFPWDDAQPAVLDVARLEKLVGDFESEHSDLEIAIALSRLTHQEYEAYGTDGKTTVTEDDSEILLRSLRAVLRRLAIPFDPPFRDFLTFRRYWNGHEAHGSWQARRMILGGFFDPLHKTLDDREAGSLVSTLASPISPAKVVGWPGVDEEIFELRRHFESASSEQDYSNVGNDAVAVIEALSRVVYVHAEHGISGEDEPAIGNTKERLTQFIEKSAAGSGNAALRKLARAAIEFAQETKHRRTGDRRSAGVAADAVILLANILRRLDPKQ